MRHPIVIVPGIGDSGPDHWQTLWQSGLADVRRIAPSSWEHPELDDWVAAVDRAVAASAAPPVLVAHSLGCLAVAHWGARVAAFGSASGADAASGPRAAGVTPVVAGALLVAPPDIDGPAFPVDAVGFTVPAPGPLPFAAVLVASSNDPYCTPGHAGDLAEEWGATLVDIGAHGHVNVASGFGPWPEGRRLLDGFVESLAVAADARTRFAEA
ncbi:serine hydrolase family protein [Agromyces tardus]|uniref:Serine hydrolase family protein n=1 Tax=Agromyces tardus TaxID=2583849 RepID=A0A3M8A332_9MICO|nr:alpha/beta fold hydrolase [Agromyces tardus]RNB45628.1 serine hydrolase family protein [Agromyces tardus]